VTTRMTIPSNIVTSSSTVHPAHQPHAISISPILRMVKMAASMLLNMSHRIMGVRGGGLVSILIGLRMLEVGSNKRGEDADYFPKDLAVILVVLFLAPSAMAAGHRGG